MMGFSYAASHSDHSRKRNGLGSRGLQRHLGSIWLSSCHHHPQWSNKWTPRWSLSRHKYFSDSVQVSDKTKIICKSRAMTLLPSAEMLMWLTRFCLPDARSRISSEQAVKFFLCLLGSTGVAAWSRVTCAWEVMAFQGWAKQEPGRASSPGVLLLHQVQPWQVGSSVPSNLPPKPQSYCDQQQGGEHPAGTPLAPFLPQLQFLVLIRDIFFTLPGEKSKAHAAVGVQLAI